VAAAVALLGLAGCGGRSNAGTSPGGASASGAAPAAPAPRAAPARAVPTVRLQRRATLPAPVQLPAMTARRGVGLLALGGLDRADASTATVTRVAPGAPRRLAPLPVALHDAGATSIGGAAYVFGGGTASSPLDSIVRVGGGVVGRLTSPASDLEAVTIGATAYAVGGYDGAVPLATITAWRRGRPARVVAKLPHPLRYAAAGVDRGGIVVAGGTDGTTSQRAIYRVDVGSGRVRTVGRLPVAVSHLAGAVVGRFFYLVGGRTRGDPAQPRDSVLAVDLRSGRVRTAGHLPRALSDVGVAVERSTLVVAGGRDASGAAADELLRLAATP
jgi:hypothetical protein